jgi:hypothetical protein
MTDNIVRKTNIYIEIETSFDITKFWKINLDCGGNRNTLKIFDEKRNINTFNVYMSNTFIFPKGIMFDINGYYRSPVYDGSRKSTTDPNVNTSLRKQFFDGIIFVSLHCNNIFNAGTMKFETVETDFRKNMNVIYSYRELGLSLRYNFKAGSNVKNKKVYSGATEEKRRLQ